MAIVRLLLAAVVIGVVVLVTVRAHERPAVVRTSGGAVTPGHAGGSDAARHAVPASPGFRGCPADGDGGDRELNRLKNRVDSAPWVARPFSSVLRLSWPRGTVKRARADWRPIDSITVAQNEGLPVAVEAYVVAVKQEGPEATNCHGADAVFRDWHLWLSATPGKDRRASIVVETTPVIRAQHPEWTITAARRLVRDSAIVRVSGWLLLDQEHPEQLRKTRGTLWEIHPVMQIEVLKGGRWSVIGDQ
jgi:hypothetical protein